MTRVDEPGAIPRHRMLERRMHALLVGATLLVAAAVLSVVVAADPRSSVVQPIDDRWFEWMESVRTPWLVDAARQLSRVGSVAVTLPLRLIVVAALAWHRRWLQLGAFVGAVVTAELMIGPLKALVDRPRPPDPLIGTNAASFPSGHAVAGAVTAFGLVVVLWPVSPRRWLAIGCAAAFAGLMALSRTILSAHWLTDTLAGACIGTGLALVCPATLEILRDRHDRSRTADQPAAANATVGGPR